MDVKTLKEFAKEVIRRKAVNPKFGGEGEKERADFIEEYIYENFKLEPRRYDVRDDQRILRPNLIYEIPGKKEETIWIITHLDTVDEGDILEWNYEPFDLTVKEGKFIGRGVNDPGIGLFSAILLLEDIVKNKKELNYTIKVGFFADEEYGGEYGLKWILERTKEFDNSIFSIVLDYGSKEGNIIEVAEKGLLWIKFEVIGKQGYPAVPRSYINAYYHAMKFYIQLYDELSRKFNKINDLFDEYFGQKCTFQPTKHESNVKSINTIPGRDVTYWDIRIIPDYTVDEIINFIKNVIDEFQKVNPVKIKHEVVLKEEPSYTDVSNEMVQKFKKVVEDNIGMKARFVGIGGVSVAGLLRKAGIPTVVWAKESGTKHIPNEYEFIKNYYDVAKILSDFLVKA